MKLYKIKIFKSSNLLILLSLNLLIFFSCSPKARYNVASIFFDGVPNPDKSKSTLASNTIQKKDSTGAIINPEPVKKPKGSIHPPYNNKKCNVCHDPDVMGKVIAPQPGLCYKCHDSFDSTMTFVHGPVASGYCTSCHSPHMSENEHLLLRKGQKLCLTCHNSPQIQMNDAHKDIGESNCTECHNPHGGKEKYFLN